MSCDDRCTSDKCFHTGTIECVHFKKNISKEQVALSARDYEMFQAGRQLELNFEKQRRKKKILEELEALKNS